MDKFFEFDSLRMVSRPELIIIRYGLDWQVTLWNVPATRVSPFFYCYWNDTPGAFIRFADRTIELTPDRILLIPPGLEHSPCFRHQFTHNFIHFVAGLPFKRLTQPESFSRSEFSPPTGKEDADLAWFPLRLYSFLFQLLLHIPRDHFAPGIQQDPRIQQAILLLLDKTGKYLKLPELARRLHMSQSSLSHLFKQQTGVSPRQYLLNHRLELALGMLNDSHADIDEIAANTGFIDRYHFSHMFKRQYGISPGAMRKHLNDSLAN